MNNTSESRLNNHDEIQRLVGERTQTEFREYGNLNAGPSKALQFSSEQIFKSLNSNEDGDAGLFIELHKGRYCYDHAAGLWYKWVEHFWKEDILGEATQAIEAVVEVYAQEACKQAWNRVKGEKAGKSEQAKKHAATEDVLLKRIRALQTKGRKENVLFLARTGASSMGITGDEWDRDPWLLGCLNGVIDLQTGEHRPGRPEDFIKTVTPTLWKGLNEPAPTWERFLDEIFSGDRELVNFIRRLFGYCLTGRTTEHISPILWGKGRNGKGTLLEILAFVLGAYSGQVEAELLLKQKFAKHSGGPSSDIMTLRGKRLVWGSETDEDRKLNAGKLKWLTGGDTLTGREVFGRRQTSFRPTHKLFLTTNHKPHANADDYALWQRINLIPFTQSFINDPKLPDERKADPTLPDRLKAEASGILAWLTRGCLEWQAEGLNPPETVTAATEQYREEEDLLKVFISEKCQTGPYFEIQAGRLFSAFKVWCEENGIRPVSGVAFGKQMKERFDWRDDKRHVFYIGLDVAARDAE